MKYIKCYATFFGVNSWLLASFDFTVWRPYMMDWLWLRTCWRGRSSSIVAPTRTSPFFEWMCLISVTKSTFLGGGDLKRRGFATWERLADAFLHQFVTSTYSVSSSSRNWRGCWWKKHHPWWELILVGLFCVLLSSGWINHDGLFIIIRATLDDTKASASLTLQSSFFSL